MFDSLWLCGQMAYVIGLLEVFTLLVPPFSGISKVLCQTPTAAFKADLILRISRLSNIKLQSGPLVG